VAWRLALVIGALTLAAVIIQVTLLSRLGLPGATPDLVVVVVVSIALAAGPTNGVIAGFVAGMLVDLAPPADTPLGVNALIYIVIGYVAGVAINPRDRTVVVMIGLVSASAGFAVIATSALDALLGSERVAWDAVGGMALSSALYALILAPIGVLGVRWLVARAVPEVLVA
jgi:rod shape-determining protein MreD